MTDGRYVVYLRVSTARQGTSGLGLEAQRQAVATYLNGGNWKVVSELVEIESGGKADRPKLTEALRLCRIHAATLVIAKLDRLSRDAHFLLGLEKAGVDFIAADMPRANRLTVGIMAMVADEERRMISARTKAALAAKKQRLAQLSEDERAQLRADGKATSLGGDRGNFASIAEAGRAAGRASQKADADARAADLAPIIADLRASGLASLRQLAQALNDRSITTPRGGVWSAWQVALLLQRVAAA